MRQFRKKPVVIEAVQFDGSAENREIVLNFTGFCAKNAKTIYWREEDQGGQIVIRTLEGDLIAVLGDWIIRGVKGEVYPCKPDIFAATYEPAALQPDPSLREEIARVIFDKAVGAKQWENEFYKEERWGCFYTADAILALLHRGGK